MESAVALHELILSTVGTVRVRLAYEVPHGRSRTPISLSAIPQHGPPTEFHPARAMLAV
jgi:hypothetical protein